jgi:hypothetical protein
MRKLITGAIVAAALAIPATPAFAIHDGTGMPGATCSNSDSNAVGHPAPGAGNPDTPNLGVSNTFGQAAHNKFAVNDTVPPCTIK